MSLISMQIFALSILLLILATIGEVTQKPNIVYILFDDLGFNDVGYNGASYKTPILDSLANDKSIKINLHYTESTCSPSRVALLTGRYPFKAGLNTVVGANDDLHYNKDLTLFPQILSDQGYKNLIVGKWHTGHKYQSLLPPKRGFSTGLYSHLGLPYNMRITTKSFTKYDTEYPTSNDNVKTRRGNLFTDNELSVADIYRIENGAEEIAFDLINDTTYSEKLYTDYVVNFINDQTVDTPFFAQINFFTPHIKLIEPPSLNTNYQYQYTTICNGLSTKKELFCKVMLYAQERIDEIKDKIQEKNLWDDTIFIITSDNGPEGYGETLPLRGMKSGANDGSLRTPAFMFGGWIERVLGEFGATHCEYNNMIHISDWYKIFTDILGISNDATVSPHIDSDHNGLQIWDDILCSCNSNCNDNYQERKELISMRVCGDENSYSTDMYPDKYYYGSYIIDNGLKLVINGSISIGSGCPNIPSQIGAWNEQNTYNGLDVVSGAVIQFNTPNQEFFDTYYKAQVTGDNAARGQLLYRSTCLDALDNTVNINNPNYEPFVYDEKILYNLSTDKIEACNIANTHSSDVTNLYNIFETSGLEYSATQNVLDSVGSLWHSVLSYNCDYDVVFLKPWEGLNEDKCGSSTETRTDVNARECQDIWKELINLKRNCPNFQRAMDETEEKFLDGFIQINNEDVEHKKYLRNINMDNVTFCIFVFVITAGFVTLFINIYQCYNMMNQKEFVYLDGSESV